ncbi:midnolin-like [Solea senegalensis]|uniref:Midnolin-like n=1 Tax=Solea senegalensis TaxID=28829 RepID=A0AAV6T7E7_SOLSE|nr:midnolin-A-like [Solea senegalensis]KAG7525360.1 midnolin-like [Solea senegalensis]
MEQQQRDLTMSLSITSTTTGGPVELTVPRGETVDGLRTRISQKLRLPRNRTVLLHKDRQLTAGKLLELGVKDGSKLTLVPVIEAGLVFSNARTERTMMDVLESLTESQISDFLSGQSHLTISLGIGGHVMYVQLQLSAQDVKTLQQNGDVRLRSSKVQSGPPTAGSVIRPGSASVSSSTDSTGSTTSPATQTSSPVPGSYVPASPVHLNPQQPFDSASSSHSSTSVPSMKCHQHSSLPHSCHSVHTSLSGCPHPSCPRQAATPVCSPAPTGSSAGPPSPVPASTFEKSNVQVTSTAELCKPPGAVIESFVSHSPGVFSGTFSGTLAPHSQSGISHPQRGISIILQILSDLLRAAFYHQGAPPTLPEHHFPVRREVNPEEETSKTRSKETLHSSTEEDQTLHCKLEHLQSLMHQRRLRRLTRSHLPQTSHPYQRQQHL